MCVCVREKDQRATRALNISLLNWVSRRISSHFSFCTSIYSIYIYNRSVYSERKASSPFSAHSQFDKSLFESSSIYKDTQSSIYSTHNSPNDRHHYRRFRFLSCMYVAVCVCVSVTALYHVIQINLLNDMLISIKSNTLRCGMVYFITLNIYSRNPLPLLELIPALMFPTSSHRLIIN